MDKIKGLHQRFWTDAEMKIISNHRDNAYLKPVIKILKKY